MTSTTAIDTILTDADTSSSSGGMKERVIDIISNIPSQYNGCIVSGSSSTNQYFVFGNPIPIKTDLTQQTKLENFPSSNIDYKNYTVIPYENINHQQTNADQIYIDCNPSGESDETIETYNLPINSALMGSIQRDDLTKMITYFCLFTLGVFVSYFFVPMASNYITLIQIVPDNSLLFRIPFLPLTDGSKEHNYLSRYGLFIVFLFIALYTTFGFSMGEPIISSVGLLVLTMTILSTALVNNKEYTYESLMQNADQNKKLRIMNTENLDITAIIVYIVLIVLILMLLPILIGIGIIRITDAYVVFITLNLLLSVPSFIWVYCISQATKSTATKSADK
jgi:hypothetical protein